MYSTLYRSPSVSAHVCVCFVESQAITKGTLKPQLIKFNEKSKVFCTRVLPLFLMFGISVYYLKFLDVQIPLFLLCRIWLRAVSIVLMLG